jgi:hypothetical protein
MRGLFMAAAAGGLLLMPLSAGADSRMSEFSSQITIGPGGVEIGPGHRRSDSRDDRRRAERRQCRELRRACEYGPRGEGNCRRYRRLCS